MKRLIGILVVMAFCGAHQAKAQADVSKASLSRKGSVVQLSLDISIAERRLGRKSVIIFTPRLVGENDSIDFPEVVVTGRDAYYYLVRKGDMLPWADNAHIISHKQRNVTEHYARSIGHQPWMDNATLKMIRTEGTGCEGRVTAVTTPAAFTTPPPDTTYVVTKRQKDEELSGRVSGEARITFHVNRTEILPSLFDNQDELRKIGDAIAQVRANQDVRITRYTLKGYASPEGSYNNNERLAKGRTESLQQYMAEQWGVPREQIATDFEPEDWQGLRQYIVDHRHEMLRPDELLAIIDRPMDPDAKLALIMRQHQRDYSTLLQRCFPQLRRTDYTIEYEWQKTVRRDDGEDRQMVITPRQPLANDSIEDDIYRECRKYQPWMALKTNMLFDLLLTPNVEIEVPIGRRWSLMVEDWFPWLLHNKGGNLSLGRYVKPGDDMKSSAYELWTVGAELRYWWPGSCPQARPRLTGHFLGLYYANGKYDVEWDSTGNQGEFQSVGLTCGYSWPLSRCWNQMNVWGKS